jgi:hypothetical protein
MLTPSIRRKLNTPAVLKSHPYTGTRSGTTQSTDLMICPVDALDPDVVERYQLETPLQMKQSFAYTQVEIKTGMFLDSGGRQYSIKGVDAYPEENGYTFYQMILEALNTK